MGCKTEGFAFVWHNHVRDFKSKMSAMKQKWN